MDVNIWRDFASAGDRARWGSDREVWAQEGLLEAAVKFDYTNVISVIDHA